MSSSHYYYDLYISFFFLFLLLYKFCVSHDVVNSFWKRNASANEML